jgi:hypothetical protein
MKRLACLGVFALLMPLVSACDLMSLVQGDATVVELFNDGDYPVEVELRYSDNQYAIQAALEEFGKEKDYTVQPGQTVTFFEPCKDLQSILIRRADLSLVGSIGPSASTDILRDGGDFGCGDRIVYTFSHPTPPTELEIDTDILD